tara:strand:+ start:4064 stop:4291 length:228 start_codon:yes stop_codon:yes gene_type:complete
VPLLRARKSTLKGQKNTLTVCKDLTYEDKKHHHTQANTNKNNHINNTQSKNTSTVVYDPPIGEFIPKWFAPLYIM